MKTFQVVFKMAFLVLKNLNFSKMTLKIHSTKREKSFSKYELYQFCYLSSNKNPKKSSCVTFLARQIIAQLNCFCSLLVASWVVFFCILSLLIEVFLKKSKNQIRAVQKFSGYEHRWSRPEVSLNIPDQR